MNKEIERKYSIKYLPKDLKINKITNIEQGFIYSDKITLVRLRKVTTINDNSESTEYIYTVKTKGDIEYQKENPIGKKYEIESNITEEEYSKLIKNQISNTINKTRIVAPISDKLKAEIDIFHGYLQGLIVVEVEFEDEEEAKKFKKPDWFGEELGYKELSNRKLSEMTEEKFKSKVTEEFLENNRKILEELENNNVINFKNIK